VISRGQILNGRYRLLSLEGEGGMADVYKATDLALDRTVALKVLHTGHGTDDAFQREARAAARLPHPNIVTIYDVGQDGDIQYIVMEYAEGQTLRDMLRPGTYLRAGQALDIAIQICDAVGFAHEKGIIHCDVKPQNVLVQPDGKVKVTDFGIARAFTAGSSEQRGKLWGTPYYAPPELISGQPLTPASDAYSIGVMLYEMLCGRRPFEGQTMAEIARQHVSNAPPPIQQLNPRITRYLSQVVDRALAKEAKVRYQSAGELGKALRAYRQHSTSATQPLQPVEVTGKSTAKQSPAVPQVPHTMLRPAPQRGIDWAMLILGGLAFLSVMGLLPLWGTVLTRALAPPTPMPTTTVLPGQHTPTPTQDLTNINTPVPVTPTPEVRVTVPDLVDQELNRARQLASEASLTLAVIEQRHDVQVAASHVIDQTPLPGQQAPLNSEIGVTVSLGPEVVTMPDVLSFPVTVKQLDLEDLGLVVAVTETASIEPAGLVISQTPTAGTVITVGSTVTLTVSSGQHDQTIQANLGNKVILLTCELNRDSFRPGDTLQVLITWQVRERLAESYKVFIHVVNRDERILTQQDAPPLGGSRPTNTWQPGEELLDSHTLSIPVSAPPGDYWIYIGLYKGDQRLPVVDPGLAETKGNAVIARQIQVTSD
jgi:serine/threonine protein kinase